MKKALIRTKDTAQNLMDDGQVTPEEYATDQMKYAAENVTDTAGNTLKSGASKAKEKAKDAIREHRQEKRELQERMEQESDTMHREPAQRQSGAASNSEHCATETARSPQESGRQNAKIKFRDEKRNRPLRRERTVRTAEQQKQAIKQSARSAGKQTIKTKDAMRKSIKTAEKTGKQIKTAAKATEKGIKTAEKSAQAAKKTAAESMKATQKFAEMARQAAIATAKAVKAAATAIGEAVKELMAAIAAGGWVSVVIIVVILMIALIVGSIFAIFFSGEDTGTGMTMRDAVVQINSEYQAEIRGIKETYAHDSLVLSGTRADWREVLSVYAVKVNTDPDNPQEVASMDEDKLQILIGIFWDMNTIEQRTESYTETVIETTVDEKGNIVETETTITRTRLYITVTHKTAEEMADEYGFSSDQRAQLAELLSDEYASLWQSALYGIDFSGDIVEVALSQVGNAGDVYWTYMGFDSRVEWCACFVSRCANECGYIDTDLIPKTAGCASGESWFRARDQWQDSSYTPYPGDIIYFDWDKVETNGQVGITDHVGIAEKVEGGYIYTIEGNSSDRVSNNAWPVGYYEIYGFGMPAY